MSYLGLISGVLAAVVGGLSIGRFVWWLAFEPSEHLRDCHCRRCTRVRRRAARKKAGSERLARPW